MKILIMFMLLALSGCQDKSNPDLPAVEKVVPAEDLEFNKENFVFIPKLKGIKVSGEKITKKGDLTFAENLSVIDPSTNKTIDEFPLFDFGPVGFSDEAEKLTVYPVVGVEIQYHLDDKKTVIRKSVCNFTQKPDEQIFSQQMDVLKAEKPAYEEIFETLFNIARNGSKEAFDFFINPDQAAKEMHSKSESSVNLEPMVNVLKFMKQNGCTW